MPSTDVLNALHEDHQEVRDLVSRIEAQLARSSTRGPVEALAAQVLDFNANLLIPHLEAEDLSLLHVAREHLADIHQPRLEEVEIRNDSLRASLEELRHGIGAGQDLRKALVDVAATLHDYVEYEENVLLPWLEGELGELLLREVAQRFETLKAIEHGEAPVEVAVDLDALAAPLHARIE